MLLNYFKIAFRNLLKNKLHTIINVAGLALGNCERFFDRNLYKLWSRLRPVLRSIWKSVPYCAGGENPQTRTPHPMAQALVEDLLSEVESAVRLVSALGGRTNAWNIFCSQPWKGFTLWRKECIGGGLNFFDVFRFPIVRGDAKKALKSTKKLEYCSPNPWQKVFRKRSRSR